MRPSLRLFAISSLAYCLVPSIALANYADTCAGSGGTAQCSGPEVGQWVYTTGSPTTGWPGGAFSSEEAAVQEMIDVGYNLHQACTAYDENPPWLDLPAGASSGSRNVGDPNAPQQQTGDYWSQYWDLGTEWRQWKWTFRIKGTKTTVAVPPCQNALYGQPGMVRNRSVKCPAGFQPNWWTAPTSSYCWRSPVAGPDVGKNLGPCKDCDLRVGNPVNVATGNKYEIERDYLGAGPFPLQYVRYYNSLAWTASQVPTMGPDFFKISPNWRGSYDRAVLFNDHPTFPEARVYRQDGRVLTFRPNGTDWVADADLNERLTRLFDASQNPIGWTLTTEADEIETYDATGRVVSIQNRAGITQTLDYDGQGRLISVTHSFGGQLSFTYDASNRVATMTVPDGGVYTYGYTSYNRLLTVTYPDTTVRTYHYEGAVRLLTGITDENGARYATYAYSSNKASSTEHAGGREKFTFAYTTGTRTTVTDALGTVRTWDHGSLFGTARATAISAACPLCGTVAKSKTFDVNGNVASRFDFNDNETRYVYDLSRNLQTSRTEAYGEPEERTITTQWHSTYRLPTLISEPGRTTGFSHDANGNVLTRTVTDTATSATRTWTFTYNSYGQVLTADGPRTDVTDLTTLTYHDCATGAVNRPGYSGDSFV